MRKTIGELQTYGQTNGKLDVGILKQTVDHNYTALVAGLKAKKYQEVRKWVNENEIDSDFYRGCWDNLSAFVKDETIPELVVLTADYQYKSVFAVDIEVNALAYLAEVMRDVNFK